MRELPAKYLFNYGVGVAAGIKLCNGLLKVKGFQLQTEFFNDSYSRINEKLVFLVLLEISFI